MGNSNQTSQEKYRDPTFKLGEEQDTIIKLNPIIDQTFEEIQIVKKINTSQKKQETVDVNDNKDLIAVKQKVIEDKKQLSTLQRETEQRLSQNDPNILKLLGYKFTSSNDICGSTNLCFLYYEYYTHNLDVEITRRHKRAEYFTENEIWYLLDSLVSACYFMQKNGIYHGDIRPVNVYLNNQGQTKLGDHSLLNQYKNGYAKSFMGIDYTYLSPELLQQMKLKQNESNNSYFKSDVYALGITILEAMTLISGQTIYDWDNMQIKQQQIQDFLNRASARYSQDLLSIISQMLQKEKERPDFLALVLSNNKKPAQKPQNQLFLAQQSQHPSNNYYYEYSPSKNNTLESYRNTSIQYSSSPQPNKKNHSNNNNNHFENSPFTNQNLSPQSQSQYYSNNGSNLNNQYQTNQTNLTNQSFINNQNQVNQINQAYKENFVETTPARSKIINAQNFNNNNYYQINNNTNFNFNSLKQIPSNNNLDINQSPLQNKITYHDKLFEELGLEDHFNNKNTQNQPINLSNTTLMAQNQLSRINQNQNNQNQSFSNINQQFASIQTPKNQNQKPIFVINIQIPINNQKISQQLKIYKETNLFQLSLEFCQTYNLNDEKNVQNLHSFLQEALTQSELQNKYNKSKSNSPSQNQNQNFSPQAFNLGFQEQNNNNIIQVNQPQISLQSNNIQTILNQQNQYQNHISKVEKRQQSQEHKENKIQYEKLSNNNIDQEQQEKNQKFNVVLSNLNNIIQKRKARNPSKPKKSHSKTQKQPKKDPIEIGQKLYETAKLKQQKHAQLIKQKQQEEEQKLFQTQKSQKNLYINKISQKLLQKQLRSKIENWPKEYLQKQEQKQKQLELQKQSQLQQELTECSFKPKINKNSENLVKNRQEILASKSTQNLTQKNEKNEKNNQIFQFLYEDAQNRKIRQQKEIEELVHMEQLKLQKLHINQNQVDKNPDQIFNEFLERQKQKQQEQEQKTQNIAFALKNIDQKSGQPLFKPQIQTQKSFKNLNKTENFSQNQQQVQKQGQAVWDHLYENGKTLEQKNQQRINDQNQIIHSKSTSKLTDNNSNSIVAKQRTYLAQLIFYALCENSPKNSQLFHQTQLQNILNIDENFQNSHSQNDNHFISKDFITLKNLEKIQIKTLYPLLQQIEEKDLTLNEKQFTQGFLIFYQQLTPLEKQSLQQIAQNTEI
ncbi:Protein kinase-like domain [Pseudocohnilembus persalinus]|uniref:Protein kinase-like domain n=1 Tax=Pseudocohnilembus persalinus TaxID=266149 RepID=A0A0V0QDA0_PSEPJ|nr:Protein kinase-like domain [Pseudocohnilembus persalinus]|eukprot:KRX00069.1 Protein kinase-like domain [Pseudocohnilembus persalinus]